MLGGGDRGVGHDGPDPLHEMVPAPRRRAATTSGRRHGRSRSPRSDRHARSVSPAAGGAATSTTASAAVRSVVRDAHVAQQSSPSTAQPFTHTGAAPVDNPLVAMNGIPTARSARCGGAAPAVGRPGLLLALAVVVGVVAFVYVSDVNDDVDRKEEAARILSQMQTSTARLGNLAALGSEPSLMLQAAGDAFALQATLGQQLRRWDRVCGTSARRRRSPSCAARRPSSPGGCARRCAATCGPGGPPRGAGPGQPPLPPDRRRCARAVAAEAADANAAGDTKTAVVTGVAIGFVVVMLALFQLGRVRLRRMRRDTAMREALHEATRESEERYRYVTDLVPDQIFTIGADGRFDYMNERTAAFLGGRLGRRCRPVARPAPPGRHAARAVDVVERDACRRAGRGRVPHAGRGRRVPLDPHARHPAARRRRQDRAVVLLRHRHHRSPAPGAGPARGPPAARGGAGRSRTSGAGSGTSRRTRSAGPTSSTACTGCRRTRGSCYESFLDLVHPDDRAARRGGDRRGRSRSAARTSSSAASSAPTARSETSSAAATC